MQDWGWGGGGGVCGVEVEGAWSGLTWGEARDTAEHPAVHMMVPQQRIPQPKTQ